MTSYTHNAVDTVLLKLHKLGVPFLRLGNRRCVEAELRDHVIGEDDESIVSATQFTERIREHKVVGATCLGMRGALAESMTFDWCIVDEASQITVPGVLGPLMHARKFVLIGDHNQLPPLVRSQDARKLGLEDSLFQILHTAHPQAVVELRVQYRMASDIQDVANTLVYSSKLVCGSKKAAARTLFVLEPSDLGDLPAAQRAVLSRRCVAFVDTATFPTPQRVAEERETDAIYNTFEANTVADMVECLVMNGFQMDRVGVITPYKRQIVAINAAIEAKLQTLPSTVASVVVTKCKELLEVSTVDKYQGKDKECIIVSLVRSNSDGVVGDLLNDYRRLNVAFTRAKSKLVVVGNSRTLSTNPFLSHFVRLCHTRHWTESMAHDPPLSPSPPPIPSTHRPSTHC